MPPLIQFFFAIRDFIAPITKDEPTLSAIAIHIAVAEDKDPLLTTKYGKIGSMPPSKKAPNIARAPFNGVPTISKLRPNYSVSMVLSQTSLSEVILSTSLFNSSPRKPFDLYI